MSMLEIAGDPGDSWRSITSIKIAWEDAARSESPGSPAISRILMPMFLHSVGIDISILEIAGDPGDFWRSITSILFDRDGFHAISDKA
eukprot:723481-Amorphochlora_amoeboformis.AAC.1